MMEIDLFGTTVDYNHVSYNWRNLYTNYPIFSAFLFLLHHDLGVQATTVNKIAAEIYRLKKVGW